MRQVASKSRNNLTKAGIAVVVAALLIGSAWACRNTRLARKVSEVLGLVRIVSLQQPLEFDATAFETVIAAYASGQLIDHAGVIDLPAAQAALTADGRVYVTHGHPCGDLFLFVAWRGKGSNLVGYLYNYPGPNSTPCQPGPLRIIGPSIHPPGSCEIGVELSHAMRRQNWYQVSRSLD